MKIYTVQEIWGDGDGNPTLTNLKVFLQPNNTVNYCYKKFEEMEDKQPDIILNQYIEDVRNCIIVYNLDDLHEVNEVEDGMFSGFLIIIYDVESKQDILLEKLIDSSTACPSCLGLGLEDPDDCSIDCEVCRKQAINKYLKGDN
jgi:hypothetical protein